MKAEFDITLSSRDMYRFSMHHAYTGSQGILSVVMAVLAFFAAFRTYGEVSASYTLVYVLMGILFIVYLPVTLYLRSKRQFLASEVLRDTLHYRVDEEGVHTFQKEKTADLPWEQVYKMIATRQDVLIYSSRVNAFILPRNQITEQYETVRELAAAHLPGYSCKMK